MRYSVFQILWFFFIYGFLGWCTEVAFQAIRQGKFVNRGFVNGPICSIYGFGVLSVLLVLEPLKDNLLILFFGSVVFTSVLEFITGWVLERLFHDKWWDYSKRPLNIKGYVCLEFSLAWGAACVFVVVVFHPLIVRLVSLIPAKAGWIVLAMFTAAWVADHIVTIIEVCKLPKRLRAIQAIEDALTAVSDEIGENIIYRGAANVKPLAEGIQANVQEKTAALAEKTAAVAEKGAEVREALELRGDEYRQTLEQRSAERRAALEQRRAELLQKREELLGRRNYVHDRINRAFPALREGKTYGRAFTRLQEKRKSDRAEKKS